MSILNTELKAKNTGGTEYTIHPTTSTSSVVNELGATLDTLLSDLGTRVGNVESGKADKTAISSMATTTYVNEKITEFNENTINPVKIRVGDLETKMGSKSLVDIGDGTVTGAIIELYDQLSIGFEGIGAALDTINRVVI